MRRHDGVSYNKCFLNCKKTIGCQDEHPTDKLHMVCVDVTSIALVHGPMPRQHIGFSISNRSKLFRCVLVVLKLNMRIDSTTHTDYVQKIKLDVVKITLGTSSMRWHLGPSSMCIAHMVSAITQPTSRVQESAARQSERMQTHMCVTSTVHINAGSIDHL